MVLVGHAEAKVAGLGPHQVVEERECQLALLGSLSRPTARPKVQSTALRASHCYTKGLYKRPKVDFALSNKLTRLAQRWNLVVPPSPGALVRMRAT